MQIDLSSSACGGCDPDGFLWVKIRTESRSTWVLCQAGRAAPSAAGLTSHWPACSRLSVNGTVVLLSFLDPSGQSLTMLPTISIQSAVAVRLSTDFASALHSAVCRQNADPVCAAQRPYGVRWQSAAAPPL